MQIEQPGLAGLPVTYMPNGWQTPLLIPHNGTHFSKCKKPQFLSNHSLSDRLSEPTQLFEENCRVLQNNSYYIYFFMVILYNSYTISYSL